MAPVRNTETFAAACRRRRRCAAGRVAAAAPIPRPTPPTALASPASPTAKLALGDIPAPTPTPASASSLRLAPLSVRRPGRVSLGDDGDEDERGAATHADSRFNPSQPIAPYASPTTTPPTA